MALWIEIFLPFEGAVQAGDEALVRRVFQYAAWCIDTAAEQATEASTAAWCAFYEHIGRISGLWERLPRYLSCDRFSQLSPALRSGMTEETFLRLCEDYGAHDNPTRRLTTRSIRRGPAARSADRSR